MSVWGPGGRGAETEATHKLVNIWDVCIELWRKLGNGMKTIRYDPAPERKQDEDSGDEHGSGDDSDGQLSEDEKEEDIDDGYWGPGEDTEEEGVYYHFRRTDISTIWQAWLEHSENEENHETSTSTPS